MHASRRRPHTLAFGIWLASRGGLVAAGFVLSAVGAVVAVVEAVAVGRWRGAAEVPVLAAHAIAWGAGVTVAFGGALQAIRRDRLEGVVALARARGAGAADYVRGRVGGLVTVLAVSVGGGTLAAGIAATSAAHPALPAARSTFGAMAYALAFAATLGPVALAALGARSRGGGYAVLLAVVVLPELIAPWTSALLPHGWFELTSIPAALDAVATGAASPARAAMHLARAIAMLAAVVGVSLVVVAAQVSRVNVRDAP
jgi:hypothetical protein